MKGTLYAVIVAIMLIPALFLVADSSSATDDVIDDGVMVTIALYDDQTMEVPVGTVLSAIEPEREGYVLESWIVDGTSQSVNEDLTITEGMNIEAQWISVEAASMNLNVSNDAAIVVVIIIAALIMVTLVRGKVA